MYIFVGFKLYITINQLYYLKCIPNIMNYLYNTLFCYKINIF